MHFQRKKQYLFDFSMKQSGGAKNIVWCIQNWYIQCINSWEKDNIVKVISLVFQIPPDRTASKPNRFVLHTSKKPYEINAPDLKTKHEWISGIIHREC